MFFDGKDVGRLSRNIAITGLDEIAREVWFLEECDPKRRKDNSEPASKTQTPPDESAP